MGREVVVALEGVTKEYAIGEHRVRALDGVSVAFRRGELASITGPSGSGKTTLLHIVGTLDRPSSGTMLIEEHDLATLSGDEIARLRGRKIGFVFQSFHLYPTLTAQQNVELPLAVVEAPGAARAKRARELLDRVGLGARLDHLPAQLSGGQRQRVAIARALANDPAYVLADEPTGALDTATGAEVLDLLRDVNASGTTVLLVTHDPEVARVARRRVHLKDGRIQET